MPAKKATVTTTKGKAADKTMDKMIRDTKSGKGTLTYTRGRPKGKK